MQIIVETVYDRRKEFDDAAADALAMGKDRRRQRLHAGAHGVGLI
jgi:hypothetical protein